MLPSPRPLRTLFAASLLAVFGAVACGERQPLNAGAGGAPEAPLAGGATSTSSSAGGDFGFGGGQNSTGSSLTDGSCAGKSTRAQILPLDIYIMLDQSSSMIDPVPGGGNKWQVVSGAIQTFINQPGLDGVSVGIQYFGVSAQHPKCNILLCQADGDCGPGCGPCTGNHFCQGKLGGSDSCDPAVYQDPDVEIAPLPGVAPAISASIALHGPYLLTPTFPALKGAVDHATAWAKAHPGHRVVDVLATDGVPTVCDQDQSHIDAVAAAGANGKPQVLTYVIGIGGPGSSLENLNSVAFAGGTGQAFLVDADPNLAPNLVAALNQIRSVVLTCTYTIPMPESGQPDYGRVNVTYKPGGGGMQQIFPQVPDAAHCPPDGDAWYYDDPASPVEIILCAATCGKLGMDAAGEVDVVIGCDTVVE